MPPPPAPPSTPPGGAGGAGGTAGAGGGPPVGRVTVLVIAAVLASTLATGALTARAIARLADESARLQRTHQVIDKLLRMDAAVTDAETGQRGFLLTGDEAYLDPYRAAGERFERHYAEALALTADDPRQNARVRGLRPLADAKFAELAQTVDLGRAGDTAGALTVVRSDRGKRLMTEFRESIDDVVAGERRLLAERSRHTDRTTRVGLWTAAAMTLITAAVLAGAAALLDRAFRRLVAARALAEAATRSRGEFLANMSHEIRTPMTAILGYAEVLRDRTDDRDDLAVIETIRQSGEHLLKILNDILDLSKIDAGRLDVRRERTALQPLFADVQSLMSVVASAKQVGFGVGFDGPVPRRVWTDPVRVRQILFNLVGNAIKFTDAGRVDVSVSYDAERNALRVRVRDSGIGIAPDRLEEIFEPFEQEDPTATRAHGGTGLGLAICRRLAGALGGDVTAESRPGAGSVFTLTLDCGEGAEGELIAPTVGLRRPAGPEGPPPALDCRVLVIDDRREMRFLVRRLIEKAGGEAVEADSGHEGLKILAHDREVGRSIAVCMLDMMMPDMDGLETARRMRADGVRVPVIALTANAMAEDRDRCLAAGCSDYLPKPIHAGDLIRKVRRWQGRDHGSPPPPEDDLPDDLSDDPPVELPEEVPERLPAPGPPAAG